MLRLSCHYRFPLSSVRPGLPFAYEDLLMRYKVSLDIFWLKEERLEDSANLPDPDVIAAEHARRGLVAIRVEASESVLLVRHWLASYEKVACAPSKRERPDLRGAAGPSEDTLR